MTSFQLQMAVTMIRCIILAVLCSIAGAQDPCNASVYKALDPEGRWVSNAILDIADASCDSNLAAAWYRVVDGPAGSDMPTKCPPAFTCGTVMPVWLSGALPQDPGVVDAIACQRDFTSCCSKTISIKLKNCGNYFVYFLSGSPLTCDAAFCFGIQAPCRLGESSETGFEPGCSTKFPAISGPANVELYTEWQPIASLYFRCALPSVDPALLYDVDWFYNKEKIHSPRAVSGTRIKDSNMADAHWFKNGRKMGFDVSCAIRARSSLAGTPSPWVKSPSRFIGIKVLSETVKIKERETAEIHLQLTTPFPCNTADPIPKRCAIKLGARTPKWENCIPEYTVHEQDCKHTIYGNEWNVTQKYRIKAKTDMKALSWDVENFVVLETESALGDIHHTWKDYQLPPVKILVENNENERTQACCWSENDPHFKTFDDRTHDFHGRGEFILYKSTDKPIEVHTLFDRCHGENSCNCGIAVRAGLDLFAINKCTGHKNQGEIECGGHGHLRIFSSDDGRSTKVHFPSGAFVDIHEENTYGKFFNVYVHVGEVEFQKTDGLCGNYDKDRDNDLPAIQAPGYYRVSEKDSFFLPPDRLQGWDKVRLGQCGCEQKNATLECDWSNSVEVKLECLPPGYRDLTCHRRNKRDVMQEDYHGFDFDDFERVPDADSNPDLSWKGNWTEAKAKDFCQNYVKQFEVVRKCAADLGIDTSSSVDNCVMDIQLTGDDSWAQTALESIKSRCMTELNFDSKYWVSDNTSANASLSLRDQMEAITCPGECNFRGTCVNGSCQCQAGYRGVSCAVDMNKGPDVTHIPRRGLCDVREKPCRMTAVLGDSFLDSANLTCRLSSFLVRETGVEEVVEVHQVPGVFESYAEVLCPAHSPRERRDTPSTMTSTGAHGYMISVANDGVLFGTPLPFVIFDSRCLDCQKSPDSITCDLKPDTCFIEGACYIPREGPYDKTCLECRPAHSQREWSIKAGTCLVEGNCLEDGAKNPRDPCYLCDSTFSQTVWKTNDECTERKLEVTDRKLWIIGAVLGPLSLLLVAVLLIWKFKVNRLQIWTVRHDQIRQEQVGFRKGEQKVGDSL